MLPHKTPRGAEALGHLKTFEGIPAPYDKQKRLCVPSAVRAVRLNPRRKVHTDASVLWGALLILVLSLNLTAVHGTRPPVEWGGLEVPRRRRRSRTKAEGEGRQVLDTRPREKGLRLSSCNNASSVKYLICRLFFYSTVIFSWVCNIVKIKVYSYSSTILIKRLLIILLSSSWTGSDASSSH